MITINDNDLPITVAEKLITATRTIDPDNKVQIALCKAFGTSGNMDQFTNDELEEIANFLLLYCE